MVIRHHRIAIIGAGPAGLSAVHALSLEGVFDVIKVFDQRHEVGGTWIYDQIPDEFPTAGRAVQAIHQPSTFPSATASVPLDPSVRTGLYDDLDSNIGAGTMQFTHTPFPNGNSTASIQKYGPGNSSRPWRVIKTYLEKLFAPYLDLTSLNTKVEKITKDDHEWVLTLRRLAGSHESDKHDHWWQETFDAVIIATGHYTVAHVPPIKGLAHAVKSSPSTFKHSKQWRSVDEYNGKKVIVVGGNVSAADIVEDLHSIVQAPLVLSQRGVNEAFEKAFTLPNVQRKPQIKCISVTGGIDVEFTDGSKVDSVDKIIFATGYKLSYPFLPFPAVTADNRLSGFYQHIFRIDDPSLVVVGQVKAGLTFRVFEYQSTAVARYFAGRSKQLPSVEEQWAWESQRIQYKGRGNDFHEIFPDFADYYNWLANFAGPPAEGSQAYSLPEWQEDWAKEAFSIVEARNAYWDRLAFSSQHGRRAKI